MTEAEWLAEERQCEQMYWHLLKLGGLQRRKAGRRKLRLFACGCCRVVQDRFDEEVQRPALETAERAADGQASIDDLRACREAIYARISLAHKIAEVHAASMVADACHEKAQWAAFGPLIYGGTSEAEGLAGNALSCHLLREVFGNPFRPSPVRRDWLAWNGGTLPAMARAIYDGRAWGRLPVLADALEDAGCRDDAVLSHCRGPGPHVRGCWVVDLLLGKG